ncbi:MAG: XVIPCD domain-containing protein [Pseudomonadota bacterium]
MASKLPPHLQHLTEGLPANRRAEVEESILSSNYLQTRLTEESKADRVDHIRILPPGSNSGGHFSETDKSIYIDADVFSSAYTEKQTRLDRVTYVLGHEVSHSAMTPLRTVSTKEFNSALSNAMWTETDFGHIDVTPAAEKYLQNARRDESVATISAWNALADRVDSEKPGQLTKQELVRRVAEIGDCTVGEGKNLRLAPGIALGENQDMLIGKPWTNSPNVEAVAKCYFDQPSEKTKLGAAGNSDYANRYGTAVIQMIDANIEGFKSQHPGTPNSIRLDFDKLGLDPKLLQSNGLNLASQDVTIYDTSHGKIQQVKMNNTGSTKGHNPEIEPELTRAPRSEYAPAPIMSEPGHPAHSMYAQALNGLRSSPNIPVGTFTEHEEQKLAAGVVAQALTQANAFPKASVDHVVRNNDGSMVIGVQGSLDSPANRLADVDIQQALSVFSIEQSSDVARTAVQSMQERQEQAQVQAETLGVDAPTSSGPVMRMGARTLAPASGSNGDGGGGGGGGE